MIKCERVVMLVNDWPEGGEEDSVVFAVKEYETDEAAIKRAEQAYSTEDTFYISRRDYND